MDEREERPAPGQAEDDAALRLLRLAGRREPVPLEREARLRAAVHAHWRTTLAERKRHRWLWVALPLAAAALIVLAVLAPLRGVAPRVIIGSVEMIAGQVRIDERGVETQAAVGRQLSVGSLVVTGDGGQVALRLDKDASLRLDVASRLAMEAGDRIRLESGAVYLDNGSGAPGRGLEIVTPFGSVQDIGTQLEVRLVGDRLRVRVREGMASLRRQSLLATVRAGEEAALGGDGAVQLTRVAADDPGWGWFSPWHRRFHLKEARQALSPLGRARVGRTALGTPGLPRPPSRSSCTAMSPGCHRTRCRRSSFQRVALGIGWKAAPWW
jgi:hypothetical protein